MIGYGVKKWRNQSYKKPVHFLIIQHIVFFTINDIFNIDLDLLGLERRPAVKKVSKRQLASAAGKIDTKVVLRAQNCACGCSCW
jgi:hypothetical protein